MRRSAPSLACGRDVEVNPAGSAGLQGQEPQRVVRARSAGTTRVTGAGDALDGGTIQPCRPPRDGRLGRPVGELADTMAAIGRLLAQTDL
jgi:hypothetical protein